MTGAAVIWGSTFAAQSAGMRHIGPFTFSAVRSLLAALCLFPASFIFERFEQLPGSRVSRKKELISGLILGVILFFAANLQQVGLQFTTAGKAGFITSLYIVIVPLFGLLVNRHTHPLLWLCVFVALAGFYTLSVNEDFTIGIGDLMMLGCAICFSLHILYVDRCALSMNAVRLSCIQFAVMGFLSLPFMLLLEQPHIHSVFSAWFTLVYAGLLSGGVAYTMQILAQRRLAPSTASIIGSQESVFAALTGWLFLHERMNGRELLGCALVLISVICSQIPFDSIRNAKQSQSGDL